MSRSWTVATLAIDAFWQWAVIYRAGGKIAMCGRRYLRIGVVAEHAFVCNGPAGHRMWIVVPGIHSPVTTRFRIPSERKFDQRALLFLVQVGAHVISRTHNVVDL